MLHRLTTIIGVVLIAIGTFVSQSVSAQVATTSAEYRYSPQYNDYIGPFTTEIWARVYRPTTLISGQRYPLIVMLHGQHASCGTGSNPRRDDSTQYAIDGTCPSNYTVVKSHEGYAYLASDLASRGYIVVSINAHRGFHSGNAQSGDSGMLRSRGKLVLWHLLMLSDWNRGLSTTPASLGVSLQNKLDFSHVGLMGHSRGGLGMRSAIADYRNTNDMWVNVIPNMTIRALLEMSPPDEESTEEPLYNAWGIPVLHLVGLCDGENPSFVGNPVPGKHFDRLLMGGAEGGTHFKASYGIEGANHRYFNTQWQQNDVKGCVNQASYLTFGATEIGSQAQRDRALIAVRNFFLSTVGTKNDPSLARIFNPTYPAPSGHAVVRAFSASPTYLNSSRLEGFDNPTGINSNWQQNSSSGLTGYFHATGLSNNQDSSYPLAEISWSGGASTNKYLQTNWASSGTGWNLSAYQYLEFRVDNMASTGTAPEFSIQLVDKDNVRSGLLSSTAYATLSAQPGSRKDAGGDGIITFSHRMMKTVRIPLSAFTGVNLANIRGARFVFNRTASGNIVLGSLVATIDSNLARGRPVTTSSNESASLSGDKAVDGSTSTRWSSAHAENQWIRVDLGWSQPFKTVILRWEAAYGKNYTIQTSNNGTSWTTVHTVTNASAGTHILNLSSAATGRYVRMNGTLRGTQWGYSLYEFEIYPN